MLKDKFPEDLHWLNHTQKVEELIRKASFLTKGDCEAKHGGTRAWGQPDIPSEDSPLPSRLEASPYDGECFWFQLDLSEIPDSVRRPGSPETGIVWVTINLSEEWEGHAYFDQRPAEEIGWKPRSGNSIPKAARWDIQNTLPSCSEHTLPEIWYDRYSVGSLTSQYDDWVIDEYICKFPSDIQIGGWIWPCQGDHDERSATFVAGLERQPFGDNGAVYLHYDKERGFHVIVETH